MAKKQDYEETISGFRAGTVIINSNLKVGDRTRYWGSYSAQDRLTLWGTPATKQIPNSKPTETYHSKMLRKLNIGQTTGFHLPQPPLSELKQFTD